MNNPSKQQGLTILEVLLVLAIMASIVVMGIRFYREFRMAVDQKKLMANVDQLFLAAANFYLANCRAGELNLYYGPPGPYTLNIYDDLIRPGYLTNWQPFNPLVKNNVGGVNSGLGYYVQLNLSITNDMQGTGYITNQVSNPPAIVKKMTAGNSQIAFWKVQVAVKLRDQNMQDALQKALSADCISTLLGNVVVPCNFHAATPNGYLVWSRVGSSIPKAYSSIVGQRYYQKAFNLLYTNDTMSGINKQYWSHTSDQSYQQYNTSDYLCGG